MTKHTSRTKKQNKLEVRNMIQVLVTEVFNNYSVMKKENAAAKYSTVQYRNVFEKPLVIYNSTGTTV